MLSNLFSFQVGWEIMDKVISVREETFPALNVPDIGAQNSCSFLREGEQQKEKRKPEQLSGQKEQLALAGSALPILRQQKWEKELDKNIWEQPKNKKWGSFPCSGRAQSSPLFLSCSLTMTGDKFRAHWPFPGQCQTHSPTHRQSQYFPYIFFAAP